MQSLKRKERSEDQLLKPYDRKSSLMTAIRVTDGNSVPHWIFLSVYLIL